MPGPLPGSSANIVRKQVNIIMYLDMDFSFYEDVQSVFHFFFIIAHCGCWMTSFGKLSVNGHLYKFTMGKCGA